MEMQLNNLKTAIVRMPGGEDLFQEVCLRCVKLRASRDWQEPQYGFIRRVARTTSIDMHRWRSVRAAFSHQVEEVNPIGREFEPSESLVRSEGERIVQRCLCKLAEPYRSTMSARYFEGMSPAEIASRHGVSVNTVQTRLKRGREKLRSDSELEKVKNALRNERPFQTIKRIAKRRAFINSPQTNIIRSEQLTKRVNRSGWNSIFKLNTPQRSQHDIGLLKTD